MYQWAVELDEGMESGEEEPDPPACNAPAPKPPVIGEDGGDNDEENEDDEEADQPTAEAWSGDDEDLIDSSTKVSRSFIDTFCTDGSALSSGLPPCRRTLASNFFLQDKTLFKP